MGVTMIPRRFIFRCAHRAMPPPVGIYTELTDPQLTEDEGGMIIATW